MQAIRQRVNVATEAGQALAHRVPRRCARGFCQISLFATGVDRQHPQALGHVVVQFAREPRSLLLLCADEPAAQLMRCGFRAAAPPLLVKEPNRSAQTAPKQ